MICMVLDVAGMEGVWKFWIYRGISLNRSCGVHLCRSDLALVNLLQILRRTTQDET
jgi:hypothetical protein